MLYSFIYKTLMEWFYIEILLYVSYVEWKWHNLNWNRIINFVWMIDWLIEWTNWVELKRYKKLIFTIAHNFNWFRLHSIYRQFQMVRYIQRFSNLDFLRPKFSQLSLTQSRSYYIRKAYAQCKTFSLDFSYAKVTKTNHILYEMNKPTNKQTNMCTKIATK